MVWDSGGAVECWHAADDATDRQRSARSYKQASKDKLNFMFLAHLLWTLLGT